MKALLACVGAAVAVGLGVVPAGAAAAGSRAGCAGGSAGGDWPAYGHDLQNTRSQPAEHVIGASNAASLRTAWTFRTTQHGMSGSFDNTPVESGGCLYDADSDGWVFALNAETGAVVWKTRLPYSAVGSATTSPDAITGSPMVDRPVVCCSSTSPILGDRT